MTTSSISAVLIGVWYEGENSVWSGPVWRAGSRLRRDCWLISAPAKSALETSALRSLQNLNLYWWTSFWHQDVEPGDWRTLCMERMSVVEWGSRDSHSRDWIPALVYPSTSLRIISRIVGFWIWTVQTFPSVTNILEGRLLGDEARQYENANHLTLSTLERDEIRCEWNAATSWTVDGCRPASDKTNKQWKMRDGREPEDPRQGW